VNSKIHLKVVEFPQNIPPSKYTLSVVIEIMNLCRSKNGMNESGTMGVKSIENVSQ